MLQHRDNLRLIEAGFPCHQVGAETQRERDTGKAPPVNRLHVWWARRPLTPSRAAILGSILPADTDPDWFLRQLGIEKRVVEINGQEWVLVGKALEKVENSRDGKEVLYRDDFFPLLNKENERRQECREILATLASEEPELQEHSVFQRWEKETEPLSVKSLPEILEVCKVPADPAHTKERIAFAKLPVVKNALRKEIKWTPEDLYGYTRAFTSPPDVKTEDKVVLDLTAGGGSIPFEALRLGCKVIANELNPVASTILQATLNYPAQFGINLADDIEEWGDKLLDIVSEKMEPTFGRKRR